MIKVPNNYDFVAEIKTQAGDWLEVFCKITGHDEDGCYYEVLTIVHEDDEGGLHEMNEDVIDEYSEYMIQLSLDRYLEQEKIDSLHIDTDWIE